VTRISELGTTPILVILMMEAKRRFLQEPHGVTSQKAAFFLPMTFCVESANPPLQRDLLRVLILKFIPFHSRCKG
jgi:hypothetical protein